MDAARVGPAAPAADVAKDKVFLSRDEKKAAGREREARNTARRELKQRVAQLERLQLFLCPVRHPDSLPRRPGSATRGTCV